MRMKINGKRPGNDNLISTEPATFEYAGTFYR